MFSAHSKWPLMHITEPVNPQLNNSFHLAYNIFPHLDFIPYPSKGSSLPFQNLPTESLTITC